MEHLQASTANHTVKQKEDQSFSDGLLQDTNCWRQVDVAQLQGSDEETRTPDFNAERKWCDQVHIHMSSRPNGHRKSYRVFNAGQVACTACGLMAAKCDLPGCNLVCSC